MEEYGKTDLKDHLDYYFLILDTLINLNETLNEAKVKMPSWRVYSETLTIKFILNAKSLYQLLLIPTFKSKQLKKDLKILDIHSILVLSRTLFENYLTYNHIYVNPQSLKEQEFRFNVWAYSSLLDRKKNRGQRQTITTEIQEKEEQEIIDYQQKLENDGFFSELSENQQKRLIKKGAIRLFKDWRTIIQECDFCSHEQLKERYGYLSGVAHTEGISVAKLRYNYLKNPDEATREAILNCYLIKMLISKLILTLVSKFKIIEIKYNSLPLQTQQIITSYSKLG